MFRIYNGVNHDVKLFDDDKIAMNRKQQAFLVDSAAQPQKTIRQQAALSVISKISLIRNQDMRKIFLPEVMESQIDILPDYYNYCFKFVC